MNILSEEDKQQFDKLGEKKLLQYLAIKVVQNRKFYFKANNIMHKTIDEF